MNGITRQPTRLYFFIFLLFCQWTSALPKRSYFNKSTKEPEYPFSYLVTRALGVVVRITSFVCRWMSCLPNILNFPKEILHSV